MESIYLAGGVFNIAERERNLRLAEELRKLGYKVILPQCEAMAFLRDGKFDILNLAKNCAEQAANCDVFVGNIDGPDADSGTAVEFGIAYASPNSPLIILVRTDFRTAWKEEIGINGMFQLAHKIIYKPAYFNSLEEAGQLYGKLAMEINEAIKACNN